MLARVLPPSGACAFSVRRWAGLVWRLGERHDSNGVAPYKFLPRHTPPGCPHGLQPLRHLPAPAALHRRADAHEPAVKRMVGKMLTGNGITRCKKGTYALVGGAAEGFCAAVELSDAKRDQLPAQKRKPSSRH